MKKISIVLMFLLIGVVAIGCQKKELIMENKQTVETIEKNKSSTPTVFLHGYSGHNGTMKTMMEQLQTDDMSKEELVIRISSEGELSADRTLDNSFTANNPMIRLVFENSRSHQWDQAEWLKTALTFLKAEYQVEEVNLVGFSMGGISSFLYLETFSGDETQPRVNKLVAIGAPFNEFIETGEQSTEDILANGPSEMSEQLANYVYLSDNIPLDTSFLLIAGELSDTDKSDGTVPLSSGLGIYSLLKNKNNNIEYQIITGKDSKHSHLKLDETVSQHVLRFLWE